MQVETLLVKRDTLDTPLDGHSNITLSGSEQTNQKSGLGHIQLDHESVDNANVIFLCINKKSMEKLKIRNWILTHTRDFLMKLCARLKDSK